MLLAVLRRPDGLHALVATRDSPFTVPGSDPSCEASDYAESVCPLGRIDGAPYTQVLTNAVAALRAVRRPSSEALASVLHVLVCTVPDPGAYTTSPAGPSFDEQAPPPARTAAHPRGFRGTKYKPGKSAAASARDLLPYLDGGGHEATLLRELAPHVDTAVALCSAVTEYGSLLADAGARVLRPYGQVRSEALAGQVAGLPAAFRRYFLWASRGLDDTTVRQLIASYWALGLQDDPALRLLIAQLVARAPLASTVEWIGALESASAQRRACLAELMLETRVGACVHESPRRLVARLDELCADEVYRYRAYQLLNRVGDGKSEEYLFDGFRLANRYFLGARLGTEGDAEGSFAAVDTVMQRLQGHSGEWQRTGRFLGLWNACGKLHGFTQTLSELPWSTLSAETAEFVVDLLVSALHQEACANSKKPPWDSMRPRAAAIVEALVSVAPEYREKAHQILWDVGWNWADEQQAARLLDDCFELIPRLCAAPFAVDGYMREPLSSLTRLPPNMWGRVRTADNTCFMALEKASKRKNVADLISAGVWSLAKRLPQLTADAFHNCTAVLCRTAKTLGGLPEAERDQIIDDATATEPFSIKPHALDAHALVALVEYGAASPSPHVSKRLRTHVTGGAQLPPAQLQRATANVLANWSAILLKRLQDTALACVAERLDPHANANDPAVRHAMMMQFSAEENRRPLRKLLRARLANDVDYVANHQSSQDWLRQHPNVDASILTNGVVLHEQTSTGAVRLSLEQDPLEVLRMGTYVGSCLGLGGALAYSAAAVVLDINKQVVYCRNERGTVLARQLVAISDAEELHCFDVYPDSAADDVKQLFWKYDKSLAAALAVPIHDPDTSGEDCIAFVLSRSWFADGAVRVD